MEVSKRKRVSAVIVKNGKVLLIQRIKPDNEYFVFPGGGLEEGETLQQALEREVKEELNLEIKESELLFELNSQFESAYKNMHAGNQSEHYFHIKKYVGTPEIGGPEKDRMGENNKYILTWFPISHLSEERKVLPQDAAKKILALFLN